METTLFRAFLETADAGSLSRAARQLEISQPSLTVQIQRLVIAQLAKAAPEPKRAGFQ